MPVRPPRTVFIRHAEIKHRDRVYLPIIEVAFDLPLSLNSRNYPQYKRRYYPYTPARAERVIRSVSNGTPRFAIYKERGKTFEASEGKDFLAHCELLERFEKSFVKEQTK